MATTLGYGYNGLQWGFGVHEAGWKPDAKLGSGAAVGLGEGTDYDEMFNRYDREYNPWGAGSDAAALMTAFDERINKNSESALVEYENLKMKKYGYSFTQVGTPMTDLDKTPAMYTGNARTSKVFRVGENGKVTQVGGGYSSSHINYNTPNRGSGPDKLNWSRGDMLVGKQVGGGPDKYWKYEKVKRGGAAYTGGGPDKIPVQTSKEVNVAAQDLSKAEEYMLWRYDMRYLSTEGTAIGSGETEDYDPFGHQGTMLDKTMGTESRRAQLGPVLADRANRADRAAGKRKFTSGVQLGR